MIQHALFRILLQADIGVVADRQSLDLIKPLLDRGLMKSWEGEMLLTEKGRQFMFQWRCKRFLQAVQNGRSPRGIDEVIQWLAKQQFILNPEQQKSGWQLTSRGRDWLSQLE
jgi:predicted transcriptional regulator